jgi:hypothetical protein
LVVGAEYAVKAAAFKYPLFYKAQKVACSLRGFIGIQFSVDVSQCRLDADHRIFVAGLLAA